MYCGKKNAVLTMKIKFQDREHEFYVCSRDCEVKSRQYLKKADKNASRFIGGVILVVIILVPLEALLGGPLTMIFVPLGLLMLIYPFTSRETLLFLGAKRATILARAIGITLIVISIIEIIIRLLC